MLRIRLYLISVLIITAVVSEAQETADLGEINLTYPVYSQYLHNGLIINPAYAGSREGISVFLSSRYQWLGLGDGAPRSQTLSMHSLLKNDHVGLGLSGQYYTYGVTKLINVNADYAYQIRAGNGRLAFGLNAGFNMLSSNYSAEFIYSLTSSRHPGSGDGIDDAFVNDEKPVMVPNVGSGFYFFSERLFFGAAVPSFLSFSRNDGLVTYKTFSDFDVLVSAGGLISFSESLKFKPSVFVQLSTNPSKPMRIDLNGNIIISDFLWIGASWRTSAKVIVGILQFQVTPQAMFGFSYDYSVGQMDLVNYGSIEAVFRYEFGYRVSAANPRYF